MKRNSGYLGKIARPTTNAANGMYDTFDLYTAKLNNSWPKSRAIASVVFNSTAINESDTLIMTVNSEGFGSNATVYYNIESGVINRSYTVINSGASAYLFSGDAIGSNPTINIIAGDVLTFDVNATGHPLWIKTSAVTGTGSGVTTGTITNNGTAVGTVSWNTAGVSPGTYYYICQIHGVMQGQIIVAAAGTGITSADFGDGLLTGAIDLIDNVGVLQKSISFDGVTDPNEIFKINIRLDNPTNGQVIYTSNGILINDLAEIPEVLLGNFSTYAGRYTEMTSVNYRVSNFYQWTYDQGTNGTQITDGSGDMYDGGNRITPVIGGTLGTNIPYNQSQTDIGSGVNVQAFPFYPQVMMFFVPKNVSFQVRENGNWGADGGGNMIYSESNELTVGSFNVTWSYVHAYNAFDPSICQLVFSVERASIGADSIIITTQRGQWTTDDPEANWNFGTIDKNRYIFYTLHSKTSGQQITTSEITTFLTNFVTDIFV
jgi:plastocyanin